MTARKKNNLLFSITKKDLIVEALLSSKSGGQRRDKVKTAIRITHPDSGAIGYSQDERNQSQNKRVAFHRLIETIEFRNWLRFELAKYQEFDKVIVGADWEKETIRTYHIPRGTVKDHRTGQQFNLKKFMDGNRE